MHLSSIQVRIQTPRSDELASVANSTAGKPSTPAGESTGEVSLRTATTTAQLPILDFIASDETLDRYGDIISASGWRLDRYRRNPVFQNAHQYGDILFTLGKALITEVRTAPQSGHSAPHLFQRIQFATDINPMARIAYGLYKDKFLNAVSVGFIPLRWEDPPSPAGYGATSPPPSGSPVGVGMTMNKGAGRARRRFLEQELLEVSAVGIPANPNALALGLKAGAIEKSDLRDALDLLLEIGRAGVAGSIAPPRLLLFQIARELHGILRRA